MLELKIPKFTEVTQEVDYKQLLDKHLIKIDEVYEKPDPVYNDGFTDVLTKGNISLIQGKAKSKKTFFIILLQHLILKANKNINNITVFDTEQTYYHSQLITKRLMQMNDDYQKCFLVNVRQLSKAERINFVIWYIENYTPDLLIIDNIRDMIIDFNDLGMSDEVLTKLVNVAEKTGTHISCVLHENKKDDNARGHLGSELVQKSETVIQLKGIEDGAEIIPNYTRNKPFKNGAFKINNDGLPELIAGFHLDEHISDSDNLQF